MVTTRRTPPKPASPPRRSPRLKLKPPVPRQATRATAPKKPSVPRQAARKPVAAPAVAPRRSPRLQAAAATRKSPSVARKSPTTKYKAPEVFSVSKPFPPRMRGLQKKRVVDARLAEVLNKAASGSARIINNVVSTPTLNRLINLYIKKFMTNKGQFIVFKDKKDPLIKWVGEAGYLTYFNIRTPIFANTYSK
jgi:hypothetical protein